MLLVPTADGTNGARRKSLDWKIVGTVFATVFVAELGDKTQLATLLFAARAENPRISVFVGAALALLLSAALGVLAGELVSRTVQPRVLSWIAGTGFIGIGVWTLVRA